MKNLSQNDQEPTSHVLESGVEGIEQEGSFFIGLTMLKNSAKRPNQELRKNIKNEKTMK
jgi:hypothetical protein